LLLVDEVNNQKHISRADATALGFPTEFRNSQNSGSFCISGSKFSDLNNNGLRDVADLGVPDWTIELMRDSNIVETTVTGNDGSYSWIELEMREASPEKK